MLISLLFVTNETMWSQLSQLLFFVWKNIIRRVDLASEVKVKNNLKFQTGEINRGVPLAELK